jgi:hypothetical protein
VSAVARRASPGYAPDLNADEFVWTHFKATLANGRPDNVDELMAALCRITKKARQRPALLRSFIAASELPTFLRPECLLVMHMSIRKRRYSQFVPTDSLDRRPHVASVTAASRGIIRSVFHLVSAVTISAV